MKNKILSAIALETIYSYRDIENIYDQLKSYDTTIELCKVSGMVNLSIYEILSVIKVYGQVDYLNKLQVAGLSGAEAGKKLRERLVKLNEK